jgi:hypothetical protein
MTLIAMGPSPRVVASAEGDRLVLDEALSGLRPSDGAADLQDALQLAVAAAGPHPSATRLVILSDGITQPVGEPVTLPFPVQYRRIGVSAENTGVTSLSVVPGLSGEEAVAHIQDFGQVASHVTAEMFANGNLTIARDLRLAPHAGTEVGFPVPPGTTTVRVELTPHDEYPLDQVALATVPAPQRVRILLVSTGDVFLQQALGLRPGAQVVTEAPSAWRPSQASNPAYDLFVFEGFVPAQLPRSAPYLLVGPPPDRSLGTGKALSPGPLVPAEANDPLLYDVDLANVDVAASADMAYSHFGDVVVTSAGGPVLMVRPATTGSPAAALLGAYLHDSNFVLRSAFPILITHLSEYLSPGTVPAASLQPGTLVTIAPPPGADRVSVAVPGGRPQVIWQSKEASAGTLVFGRTEAPGLYRVDVARHDGTSSVSYFAVAVPGQSISPQPSLQVTGTATKTLPASSTFQSFWPWLVAAALALLLTEWVVYHRAG